MRTGWQVCIHITQVLTEVNQHLAVALPHVLWHSQDTGHIVIQERVLLLHKTEKQVSQCAYYVTSLLSRLERRYRLTFLHIVLKSRTSKLYLHVLPGHEVFSTQ